MRKLIYIAALTILLSVLTGCGGQSNTNTSNTTISSKDKDNFDDSKEMTMPGDEDDRNRQIVFKVSDFIGEPDNKLTKATGGRAYELEEIPSFPDATKHFEPSTEDYCLMCYPAMVYLKDVDSAIKIAKFDLISWDTTGKVDSHYQAFVFDSAEEAEEYHEFREERDGVKYRELYAGSNLSDDMMTGCAKRYDNIIYFNVGTETVGMEEAYHKTYLIDESDFYKGIGYSYLFSAFSGEHDAYSHYQWLEEDNEYFYPVSHRFAVSRMYQTIDLDGVGGADGIGFIEYTLHNYDEYGNQFSTSSKFEILVETNSSALLAVLEDTFSGDAEVLLESVGETIYIDKNRTALEEDCDYFNFLGEEYNERDAEYKDGQFPEAGMGKYLYFSYRDKECPTEVSESKIAKKEESEESGKDKKEKKDISETGIFEAYFCSEEMDEVLQKPSCEMFVGRDGEQAILHIYEYKDGKVTYESKAMGNYDEIFTPDQVSAFEADNLADSDDDKGEYVLTTIDKDNFVINVDFGNVLMDYLLQRSEHTVQ